MGYESNTGLGVHNQYGPRDTGYAVGTIKTEGALNEVSLRVTGAMLNSTFIPEIKIPAGAVILKAVAHVKEAFVLGGTTPTILVGTEGSEVTNGFVLAEASAEALGYYDLTSTLAGTWDAEAKLAAATQVGIALGGTNPTASATAGKVTFVVTYTNV